MRKQTNKGDTRRLHLSKKPVHRKMSWPGLKARDHLSRVVCSWLKEKREAKETEEWAQEQIAKLLDHLSSEAMVTLIFREMWRRNAPTFEFADLSARACEELMKYGAWRGVVPRLGCQTDS